MLCIASKGLFFAILYHNRGTLWCSILRVNPLPSFVWPPTSSVCCLIMFYLFPVTLITSSFTSHLRSLPLRFQSSVSFDMITLIQSIPYPLSRIIISILSISSGIMLTVLILSSYRFFFFSECTIDPCW